MSSLEEEWKQLAFSVAGHKFYVGDDVCVHAPKGVKPFIGKLVGVPKRACRKQFVDVCWYYRKAGMYYQV